MKECTGRIRFYLSRFFLMQWDLLQEFISDESVLSVFATKAVSVVNVQGKEGLNIWAS